MRPKKGLNAITYKKLSYILAECIVASFGLFFTGYQMSALDDMQPALAASFKWNDEQTDSNILVLNLIFIGGGFLGALGAGFLASTIGRKKAMIFADFVGFVGIGASLVVETVPILAIGRALVGISAGINTVVVPIFIFEMLPREVFHKYGPISQISFTIGFVLSHLIATFAFLGFKHEKYISSRGQLWRALLGIPLATSLIRCMFYIFCWEKDTAKFYIFKNQDRDASDILRSFYRDEWILAKTRELISIKNDQSQLHTQPVYANMFNKKYINRTLVCLGIALFKQFAAVNAFLSYKNRAIIDTETIGDNSNIVVVSWSIGALIGVLATAFSLKYRGKKKVLLMGSAVMIVMASFIVICGFEKIPILAEVSVFLYVAAYSFSYGPLSWMFYCQLLPDKGISVVQCFEWAFSALLVWLISGTKGSSFFLKRSDLLVFFLIMNTFGFFFIMQFVREIKGKDYFTIKRKFESEDEDERVKEVFYRNKPSIFD